ncbi:MAG: DUF721 domain-containing protein [Candidatus Eremiobacteraeota bacterium]|nr:DUF721 domain-containing protein [Candidatus Eremiobacteraeota bacterium]
MLKLGRALGGWSPGEGDGTRGCDPVILLAASWPAIVGTEVSRNSHPQQMQGDALLVTTRSSAWSQQLTFLTEEMLRRIRVTMPDSPIERFRFRVGRLPSPTERPRGSRGPSCGSRPVDERPPAADAAEAIARFRLDVTAARRAKRAAGWNECSDCTALMQPDNVTRCVPCSNARYETRRRLASRLLFEAPWLGYAGTAELIDEFSPQEYETIRRALLARWWETLARARARRALSADGHERLTASSFVILKSGLSPERIGPATVRNALGDELHQLIYGMERVSEINGE